MIDSIHAGRVTEVSVTRRVLFISSSVFIEVTGRYRHVYDFLGIFLGRGLLCRE
jgi:hypothetical protein